MQIRNITAASREIADTGQVVEPGDTAEVDDDLGRSLAQQTDVWDGKPSKAKPTAEKEN